MGTRGFISFEIDGQRKTAYNHFDSYPDGLGLVVLEWLRKSIEDIPELRRRVQHLRVVDSRSKPTEDDIRSLKGWSWDARAHGGTEDLRSGQEWYDLLHRTQGNPEAILTAGIIEDSSEFPFDSLFAEYGYVIDLDKNVFEAYRGFQEHRHSKGRFARDYGMRGYYPVALVSQWSLDQLPDNNNFLYALQEEDEEQE